MTTHRSNSEYVNNTWCQRHTAYERLTASCFHKIFQNWFYWRDFFELVINNKYKKQKSTWRRVIKSNNKKLLTQTQHQIARTLIPLGTAAASVLNLRSNFPWITIINDWQYYKKDTSKVYVIWSSPRELISVQIISLDFRLQKIQLKLIMTQKKKRFRHYCRNIMHEIYLIKFKFEKLCEVWKTYFVHYCWIIVYQRVTYFFTCH